FEREVEHAIHLAFSTQRRRGRQRNFPQILVSALLSASALRMVIFHEMPILEPAGIEREIGTEAFYLSADIRFYSFIILILQCGRNQAANLPHLLETHPTRGER